MSLIYAVHETRSKIREIQINAKSGLVSELVNKSTHESMYMLGSKMFDSIIKAIQVNNMTEYDEKLGIYTIYNELVPQIVGEGKSKEAAMENIVEEAIVFAQDYLDNVEVFSGIFNGLQQLLISKIILCEGDKVKVKEVLKVA